MEFEDIHLGQTVTLNSGGAVMTVYRLDEAAEYDKVYVTWIDNNNCQETFAIHNACLREVK